MLAARGGLTPRTIPVVDGPLAPFAIPFVQRAVLEIALLSVAGGLLGSWIVLRRLAFYTHAVGAATFPGLVVAGPWGLPPKAAGLGASMLMALGLERLTRSRHVGPDAATGLLLVAALGVGVVLASDVYSSGAGVDQLLFGSLLGISRADVVLGAAAAAGVVALNAALFRPWLVSAFDPSGAPALGVPVRIGDWVLLAVVAGVVVVSVDAVGALLTGALFVVPSATVLLLTTSVRALQLGSVALTLTEGIAGLWVALALDVPPGPAIAVLGGAVFGLVALAAGMGVRRKALAQVATGA